MVDQRITFDFSLLPSVESAGILTTLDPEIEERFDKVGCFNETRSRARGALMLFCDARGHDDAWRDEAYVRAGLNEFYSIGEALVREHRSAFLSGKPRRILESRNPLIHLMLLMRHVNVHTKTCAVARHRTTVISHLGEPHEFTYTAAIIDDLSVDHLLQRRETERMYDRGELARVVSWFTEKQKVFGVHEVFTKGTELLCQELLTGYGARR